MSGSKHASHAGKWCCAIAWAPLVIAAGCSDVTPTLTGISSSGPRAATVSVSATTTTILPGSGGLKAVTSNTRIVGLMYQPTGPVATLWAGGSAVSLRAPEGPALNGTYANDINDRGVVVGFAVASWPNAFRRAVIWTNGIGSYLQAWGTNSNARAINAGGDIVGNADLTPNHPVAVIWRQGRVHMLRAFTNYQGSAEAINTSGQIVGYTTMPSLRVHAVLWQNDTMTDLGTLGGLTSHATAINSAGDIVGYSDAADGLPHAFLYTGGVMHDLGTLPGGASWAYAINDRGEIVGQSNASNRSTHAVLWQNGVIKDLDPLDEYSYAVGINNEGLVIGLVSSTTVANQMATWRIR